MRSSNPSRARAALTVAVGALALLVTACTSGGSGATRTVVKTVGPSSPSAVSGGSSSSNPAAPTKSSAPATPVHIKLFNVDHSTYGVGMPIIAFFSKKIASAKALQAATTATVNGKPMPGAWYFEYSDYLKGYPIEGHFRPQDFWPPHSQIYVKLNTKGVSAGAGMAFDDSLFSTWSTGAANIATVDDSTKTLTLVSDGHKYGSFKVSLGASRTPTKSGVKVVMEQVPTVCMHDTNGTYFECGIKEDQRLTYSGEYLHSAPWNHRLGEVDSSNGCTNLSPADATKLYHFMHVGDVVKYPNANGPAMTMGDGYGDWNVEWGQWQTGGLVSTV